MAKNHKWKDTTVLTNITKNQECIKCGIGRTYLYGDMQCWEYVWNESHINENGTNGFTTHRTFHRPECGGKKI
jgi:hypothetical protein